MNPTLIFHPLALLLLVVLPIAVYTLVRTRQAIQLRGVQQLQAMRMMVMHVQRHRGLIAAYLAGEQAIYGDTAEECRKITLILEKMRKINPALVNNHNWQGITEHWARLSAKSKRIDAEQSFEQHCKLIINLLQFMREISLSHKLTRSIGAKREELYWHELLIVGELIGQLRAIGVRVLLIGAENDMSRHRQRYIGQRIEDIKRLISSPSCRQKLAPEKRDALRQFIDFVDDYLVHRKGELSATDYFSFASNAVESVYECFDEEMNKLYRRYSLRFKEMRSRRAPVRSG